MKRLGVKFYDDSDITYRGQAESDVVKDVLASLKDSVLRGYTRGQRTAREVEQISKAVYYQNISVNKALLATEFDMEIQNEVGSNHVVWRNFYDGDGEIVGTTPTDGQMKNVTIEDKFGQLVLKQDPDRVYSKIPIYTDRLGVKHPSASVKIYTGNAMTAPITTNLIEDRDNSIYGILDGETSTFWLDDDSGMPLMAIDITFPSSLTTRANAITIDPFPFNVCKIYRVQYKPLRGTTFVDLDLPSHQVFPGLDSAPMRLHFNPVDYGDEVRIILESTKIDGKYVYGLADVNVEYLEYASNGHMYDDLQIPEHATNTINKITSFEAYVDNNQADTKFKNDAVVPVKFQLMKTDGTVIYDSQEDGPFELGDTELDGFNGQTIIRVKTEMNNIGNVSPVVRGYRITYTTQ